MKLTEHKLKEMIRQELKEAMRRRWWDHGNWKGEERGLPDDIQSANHLLLYAGREGMVPFPIKREQDGDYVRFFINKDGQEIEFHVDQYGKKVYRQGRVRGTNEKVDLIPNDTSGNEMYGGIGNISLKYIHTGGE